MAVRTFTMPKSLNESLARSQAANSEPGTNPKAKEQQSYSETQREPLASHKPDNKPGITYAAQDDLPKLPIPELDKTCQNYLNALRPLQTRREQEDTAAAVSDFLKGEGHELNSRLKKYATGKTSYIEQFCRSISMSRHLP